MRGDILLSCRTSVDFARLRLAARDRFAIACGMTQAIAVPRRRRWDRAFTLLEVMAAVALLGTVYTVLGGAGIQGLQHEGESRRRIQASMVADMLLAELEAGADAGQVPPPGKEERQQDEFTVQIEVAPLDLIVPDDPNPLPQPAVGGTQTSGLNGNPSSLPKELASSLLHGEGNSPSPLRRITVRVGWNEGWGDRSVVRTTYALDAQSAQQELAALDASAAAAAPAVGAPVVAVPGQPAGQPQAPQTGNPTQGVAEPAQ